MAFSLDSKVKDISFRCVFTTSICKYNICHIIIELQIIIVRLK